MAQKEDQFKKVLSHAKEYGYIFQSSEIYDGLSAVYDYAQNGVELKKNIRDYWWKAMVQMHENIVGLDASILMHPTTWKASGHVDAFNDPLIDNKDSKKRYRADVLIEDYCAKIEGKIDKEVAKAEVGSAIRQGLMAAKKAGKDMGNGALGLGELLAPKVDWVEQMKHFIRSTCTASSKATFRRINRRFFVVTGLVMPTTRGECIKELVVAPDVSGSMFFDNSFDVCMSEIEGLAKQLEVAKIHLIYWDGHVCAHEEYTSSTFKDWRTLTKPYGGGGTDPTCVANYLREKKIKPDAAVILTDGEVMGWGEWDCPVLWGIHNRYNKITAPVGKTIQLEQRI